MPFPTVPYEEDPGDAALLKRANMFYEVPILNAISHALNQAWHERDPKWEKTGRRVPPYVPGDYGRAIEVVRQSCEHDGHPLPPVPDKVEVTWGGSMVKPPPLVSGTN